MYVKVTHIRNTFQQQRTNSLNIKRAFKNYWGKGEQMMDKELYEEFKEIHMANEQNVDNESWFLPVRKGSYK